jgi:hypothetical protein
MALAQMNCTIHSMDASDGSRKDVGDVCTFSNLIVKEV